MANISKKPLMPHHTELRRIDELYRRTKPKNDSILRHMRDILLYGTKNELLGDQLAQKLLDLPESKKTAIIDHLGGPVGLLSRGVSVTRLLNLGYSLKVALQAERELKAIKDDLEK